MRSVARWLLCALLPLSCLACGQQGRETASVEQDLIGYWRARLKDTDGDLFDATWAFKADRSYALWIALLAKDGTAGQSRQMATGTWSVNGRKLVILSETDGKAEVQKFTVSELAEKSVVIKDESDGETATLRRVDSAPGDVARAASPQSQAKAQQAQKQESKPTLIAQASEFVPDKQSRYLYLPLLHVESACQGQYCCQHRRRADLIDSPTRPLYRGRLCVAAYEVHGGWNGCNDGQHRRGQFGSRPSEAFGKD